MAGALDVTPAGKPLEPVFPDGAGLVTEPPLVMVPEETTPGPPLAPELTAGPAEVVLPFSEVVVPLPIPAL